MTCDCQRDIFNCEENVRRFLGVGRRDGSMDLSARDELMEKVTPLVERIVNRKFQGIWRQDRENVAQEVFLKLCDPAKLRTWLESPRRTWFCHWAAVVASHTAIEWIRRSGAASVGCVDALAGTSGSDTALDLREQAEALRATIIVALSEFDLEWRLVFYMKYSYLKPCISDIARGAGMAEETVFFRLRKIKEALRQRCESLISPAVAKVALAGTRHPVDWFDRLESAQRDQINRDSIAILASCPIKQQLAFHMKYSPPAVAADVIAAQVGEEEGTVLNWLVGIEAQIRRIAGR